MAPNVLVKPNARSLLFLAGAADSLAPRRDYEVINDFCHAPFFLSEKSRKGGSLPLIPVQ